MYESISGLTKNGLNLRYKPTAFGKKRKSVAPLSQLCSRNSIVKVWRPQLKKKQKKTKQKKKKQKRKQKSPDGSVSVFYWAFGF